MEKAVPLRKRKTEDSLKNRALDIMIVLFIILNIFLASIILLQKKSKDTYDYGTQMLQEEDTVIVFNESMDMDDLYRYHIWNIFPYAVDCNATISIIQDGRVTGEQQIELGVIDQYEKKGFSFQFHSLPFGLSEISLVPECIEWHQ